MADGQTAWFPVLCTVNRVAGVLALSGLVVLVANVLPFAGAEFDVRRLLSSWAFAAWMSVTLVCILCMLRNVLAPLPRPVGMVAVIGVVFLATALASVIVLSFFYSGDTLKPKVDVLRFGFGVSTAAAIVTAMVFRYFEMADRWRQQVEANAHARADALQARIHPHFLFNSMNLIASLVRRDAGAAEKAVLDLSDLFRAAINAGERASTLENEVALARGYLNIEQLRMGERLRVSWVLGDDLPMQLAVPLLMLQPLVENAVLHGISQLPEGGEVAVAIARSDEILVISVTNPVPDQHHAAAAIGTGHALKNIRFRLAHMLGPAATVQVMSVAPDYHVRMTFPLRLHNSRSARFDHSSAAG